jgi:cytosine/adenosine deaminase-related metal-dependent hydrolase
MLQTMNAAYKVARMGGTYLPATRMFYLATLGGARSMQLETCIGNFVTGAEADFNVLDPQATTPETPYQQLQFFGRIAVCTGVIGRRPQYCSDLCKWENRQYDKRYSLTKLLLSDTYFLLTESSLIQL